MGVIKDTYEFYDKWGAPFFSALFGFDLLTEDGTDGLKWLLQEMREKTSVAIGSLEDEKVEKVQYDNSVRVYNQIEGGAKRLSYGVAAGAIKIKLPFAKTSTLFQFEVSIISYAQHINSKFIISGYNRSQGFGTADSRVQSVVALTNHTNNLLPNFYFCTGATEDYILIGEVTDIIASDCKVSITNVTTHYNSTDCDWSTGWDMSLITNLESLDTNSKITVKPQLISTQIGNMNVNIEGGLTQQITSQEAFCIKDGTGNKFLDINSVTGRNTIGKISSSTPSIKQIPEIVVSTTDTNIAGVNKSAFFIVEAEDEALNTRRFVDVVLAIGYNSAIVIGNHERETPASRTYSVNSNALNLRMSSGTYKVRVTGIGNLS